MSDNAFDFEVVRQLNKHQAALGKQGRDIPAIYLPWAQRYVNPFLLANSGLSLADSPLPWVSRILAFYCTVYPAGLNNGTNYWTVFLNSYPSATTIASFNTTTFTTGQFTRVPPPTISQPLTTDVSLSIVLTATLSPGSLFVFPAVALLR